MKQVWHDMADQVARYIVNKALTDAIRYPTDYTMEHAIAAIALHGCCLDMMPFDEGDKDYDLKEQLHKRQAMMDAMVKTYNELTANQTMYDITNKIHAIQYAESDASRRDGADE